MSERTGLKEWREANGLTVREVAALTGLSASEVSRAERGLVALPALKKVRVARALNVALEDLFSETDGHSDG
mgnify:CR=1 FL=1